MITSEQIKLKIEEAKTNPVVARELQSRLETGKFDTQLNELGLERGKNGLQRIVPKTTYGQNLAETFTRAGERIKGAVTQAQQDFQAGTEMTDGGIITPEGVAKSAGAVVRGVGRTLGTVAGATFAPVLDIPAVKSTIESGVEKAMGNENISALAGKAAELAQKYPEAAKDLEDIVNIATVGIGKVGEKPVQELATKVGKRALTAPSELTASIKALSKPKFIKTITDTAQDVIPKADDLRDRTLAKALRLAPVEDISVIKQSTGNDIGEFMNRFDLVKDTPDETVDALAKFQRQNFDRTRDAIALVDNKFTFQDIPELKDTIDFLKADLQGRKSPEYQQVLAKLNEISAKPEFELLDAQYVKNVFDDVESIYKRTGDVRDAVAAQDKAQTIAPVRRFIEDRVQEVYPEIDIRALNNNVQTSRAIMDAVLKRAPKADTSSFFQLGDLAILGVGNIQTPGLGYGALFAKKVFESAPIQLRLSRAFAGKVKPADVVKGLTPEKLKTIDDIITKELKASMLEPEQVSVLKKVQDEIYKVKAKTTTTNKIPKNTSIEEIIPKTKSQSTTLKAKGAIPENSLTSSIQKAKASGQSFDEWVKGQGEVRSEVKKYKLNPDNIEYHGTGKKFDEFLLGEEGSSGAGTQDLGVFTTKSKEAAKFWAEKSAGIGKDGNVMSVYLDIKNPKVFKTQKALDNFLGDNPEIAINKLKSQGFDSIKYPESGIDKFPFDYWDELASKGVKFKNQLPDEPYMTTQVFDPKNIHIIKDKNSLKNIAENIQIKNKGIFGAYPDLKDYKPEDISLLTKDRYIQRVLEHYSKNNKTNPAETIKQLRSQLKAEWDKIKK